LSQDSTQGNTKTQIGKLDVIKLLTSQKNSACHNLLQKRRMPSETLHFLRHGLFFCFKPTSTSEMITHASSCMDKDVRRIWVLRGFKDNGN
jgi:hypothetical protein